MKQLRRIAVLVATMLGTLILTTTSVMAMPEPPADGGGFLPAGSAPAQPVTITTSDGLATWQIAVIAIGAALFALLATELVHLQLYRRRAHRQSVPAV
jgi:hypothetical protein